MGSIRLCLVCILVLIAFKARAEELTPQQALTHLRAEGSLRGATIVGDLNLTSWDAKAKPDIKLYKITLKGRLLLRGKSPLSILCMNCDISEIDMKDARLHGHVEFYGGKIHGFAGFGGTTFAGDAYFHNIAFEGGAEFQKTRFEQAFEMVNAQFNGPPGMKDGVSFADVLFKGRARFDATRFSDGVRFDSSIFEGDASFLKLEALPFASFRNVQFKRDAEFRFCRLGVVDFGDDKQMSLFQGLTDFRGCRMGAARFDYAEFRGSTTFVNATINPDELSSSNEDICPEIATLLSEAHLKPGDLSLSNASFRAEEVDLDGLRVDGALRLKGTHFAGLRLDWLGLGQAVIRGEPDSHVLRPIIAALEKQGADDDAREVGFYLEEFEFRRRVADHSVAWPTKAWYYLVWFVWGWPTGYGTKLGRIVMIALLCWLATSIPLAVPRGTTKAETLWRRLLAACACNLNLMFKLPGIRYTLVPNLPVPWRLYVVFLKWFGNVFLTLAALTLTKVSPVLQAIVGKILG